MKESPHYWVKVRTINDDIRYEGCATWARVQQLIDSAVHNRYTVVMIRDQNGTIIPREQWESGPKQR